MWIGGLDALRKPLLHLHTQANVALPWASIDMDFMNLNQAAHGDREFGYIQTRIGVRRTTVVGHVDDPRVAGAGSRLGTRRRRLARPARRCGWPASATTCATSPSPRATRSRPRSRFGVVGQHLRRSTSWSRSSTPSPDAAIDALVAEYDERYDVVPELRPGGERHESLRYGARIEARAARASSSDGGFGAFTTNFEDLGGLRQLPGLAVQRLMADGYGFGGEGDWKTAVLVRILKVDGARAARRHVLHGGLHLPPRPGPAAHPRRPHARGLPDDRRRHADAWRSIRSGSAAARTPCAWCSTPSRATGVVVGAGRPRRPLPARWRT